MCRMLALLTKNEYDEKIFLDFLSLAKSGYTKPNRSEGHLDGWGIGGFLANYPTIFYKSANSVLKEKNTYLEYVQKTIISKSRFTIVHFRKASSGNVSIENTHPFLHKEWIFAHNGTILEKNQLSLEYNFCDGTTDSEHLFNFIIENLGLNINFIPRLVEILKYVKNTTKHTSLTFFLTNSDYFVVYREYSNKYAEKEDNPSWNRYYYTMFFSKTEDKIIFCSQPLKSASNWIPIKNSHLIAINKNLEIEFNEKI